MSTKLSFIQKRPVPCYYILAFVISTGGVFLLIGGFSGIPATPEDFARLLPHDIWAARISAGDLPLGISAFAGGILLLAGQLPAFRLFMVRVYDRTGSLLVAMLMHFSLTACTFILGPGALVISGTPLLIYGLALAAGM